MEIVVIGMGYVGIPTAALLASVDGFNVKGVQRLSKRSGWKIDYLNQGKCPIEGDEPGLSELIESVVKNGSFRVTEDISICRNADVILIDVQTPVDELHIPQYASLREVTCSVGEHIYFGAGFDLQIRGEDCGAAPIDCRYVYHGFRVHVCINIHREN